MSVTSQEGTGRRERRARIWDLDGSLLWEEHLPSSAAFDALFLSSESNETADTSTVAFLFQNQLQLRSVKDGHTLWSRK